MSQMDDSNAGSSLGTDDGSGGSIELDDLPDAAIIADVDTRRIVEANTAAGELFHCSPADLVGRHQTALHPSDDPAEYIEAFRRGIDGQRVNRLRSGEPLFIETVDGQRTPVEINARRIDAPEGGRVLGIFRDVTDQLDREQKLERTTSRLETLLDTLPVPVAVLDTDGVVERWNRAAERTLGYSADSIVGRSYSLFTDGEEFESLLGRVLDGETIQRYETTLRAQDGSRVPVTLHVCPVYENGTLTGLVGVAVDLSEQRQREQQLDVLHRVTRHNLRNELSVIRGWSDQIANDETDPGETAQMIADASDRLLELSEEAANIRNNLADRSRTTDPMAVDRLFATLTEQLKQRDEATVVETPTEPEPGAVPRPAERATVQLFRELLNCTDEATVEFSAESFSQYLRLELTGNAPLLCDGERTLIKEGGETALKHASGLKIANAYLLLQSIGGAVTLETGTGAAPESTLRVEMPKLSS